MDETYTPPVKATTTSSKIIDTLIELESANVTVVAEETGLSKSSVHNHLETLEHLGFVVKTNKDYRISLRFLQIGNRARKQYAIYQAGKEDVERLVSASGLFVGLMVLERQSGICIYTHGGTKVDDNPINEGDALPLHCTAPGKAILSTLPEERVDALISDSGQEQYTERTLTTRTELRNELETVRSKGLAVDREEWQTDLRGIARSITGPDNVVHGAIYVLSPMECMSGKRFQQDIPGLVISSANQIRKILHNQ